MSSPTALRALQGAAELAMVEWDGVGDAELLEAAVVLGRLRAVVDGALVGVAERLEATGAAESIGWASTRDFLTHVLGGRKGTGGGLVRLAQRTAELPAVREALTTGAISSAQAGVIAGRVATLPRDPQLREEAADVMLGLVAEEGRDATDLDLAFGEVVRELDPDGARIGSDVSKEREERGAHAARFLALTPDTLGGVRIKGYGTVEDAELIKTTLMPLSAPVVTEPGACGGEPGRRFELDDNGHIVGRGCPTPGCPHTGKDPRDHGTRLWDALVEACRRLQATDQLPTAHGTTARISVTIGLDALQGKVDRDGLLPCGERLSAAAVRRLACDAEIIPAVLGPASQVLDVGRTHRLVTPGIWNALLLRDRHCAFPGCRRQPLACDAHHIVHWADGGTTSLDNLILLCRRHHTTVHTTPWTVHIHPDTHQPVWTPPPKTDQRNRFTYHPGNPPPPTLVA